MFSPRQRRGRLRGRFFSQENVNEGDAEEAVTTDEDEDAEFQQSEDAVDHEQEDELEEEDVDEEKKNK